MRYFIAFLVTFGLILLLLVLLFHGGSGKPKTPTGRTLVSFADTDTIVRMTIDGPINADQNHQAIQVMVSSGSVTYTQIQGYQGNVVNQQTYPNNQNAYTNFLYALAHAGFTDGNKSAALKDERGYCPLGDRYIFEVNQDGQELERYWATSCGSPKSYLGSVVLTMDLFQAQVPNYASLSQGVIL